MESGASRVPGLSSASRRSVALELVAFASVGVAGTAAQYLTLTALVEWGHFSAVRSSIVGYLAGAAVNYWLNHRVTFRSGERHIVAAPKFLTIAAIGLGLNSIIMTIGAEWIGLHYLLAQVVATVICLFWHFLGNRVWTFRARGA
jgi:putative flippase GtrA